MFFNAKIFFLLEGKSPAEYVVEKERLIVPSPEEVSAAEGTSLLIATLKSHKALVDVAGIKLDGSGQRINVLVIAASGGVGHYAVQLAKLGNAHVTGTCRARNVEFTKNLGADEVLDYKTSEDAKLKSPLGQKYDEVVHCARDISWVYI
ncbi:putative quinone-oxidoreductase -like protein, chloroplastic [Capsicum chinense]|nr:putative quinone-oxidoreductase -like protein, chloroplastic [Capsicum chinense]